MKTVLQAPLTPMACLRWPLIRGALARMSPRDVLEVGCGQGAMGTRLAARVPYTGVEPDLASWSVASDRIRSPATLVHGTDAELPAGRTWDMVCAFEVLEHLADDAGAVQRWFRLLTPGGHLLLTVPAWQKRFGPSDDLVGHYRRYDPGALPRLLQEHGFHEVEETLYGWPLGYALETCRDRVSARRMAGAVGDADFRGRTSGRYLQPKHAVGLLVRAGTLPFVAAQRLQPRRGTGIFVVARRPTGAG